MKYIKNIYGLTAVILALSCHQSQSNDASSKGNSNATLSNKKNQVTIAIQPFVGFPKSDIAYIANELKKIYAKTTIKTPIEFPANSLNQTKKRYRADALIKFLSTQTKAGYLTIGLTTKDISTTKGSIPDWGVMGLGYCPGKSCIASTFRIRGKNKLEKLFKVAIHELGHTQGLPHCPIKTCLMRDAEGKDHLDEEKEFCPKCKGVLIKAGWALN